MKGASIFIRRSSLAYGIHGGSVNKIGGLNATH